MSAPIKVILHKANLIDIIVDGLTPLYIEVRDDGMIFYSTSPFDMKDQSDFRSRLSVKNIECRMQRLKNIDPHSSWYHGCDPSANLVWSDWGILELAIPDEKVESRL